MAYYPQREADVVEMKNIFDSLHVCIKIFYDLSAQVSETIVPDRSPFTSYSQELAEHFEDNLTLYMTHFMTLLSYDHPRLHSDVSSVLSLPLSPATFDL